MRSNARTKVGGKRGNPAYRTPSRLRNRPHIGKAAPMRGKKSW